MTKKAKTWTCAVAALACVAAVLCFALRSDAPYEVEYITAKVEKATIGNSGTLRDASAAARCILRFTFYVRKKKSGAPPGCTAFESTPFRGRREDSRSFRVLC